jgi:TRAP-type C4-dicarboxylate transport system permease large subunit
METIETTAGVLLIVGAASLFGWVLTTTRVTEYTTEALLALTDNRYVILLLTNVLLLVIGCFLEPIASISILVPVLMPVIVKVGIDPVHFGVMMTLNLMIGTAASAARHGALRAVPGCQACPSSGRQWRSCLG